MDSHRFIPTFEPFPPPTRGSRRVDKCKHCGERESADVHGMTFEQLFQALSEKTPEQRAQPVRWWGDERGGIVLALHELPEPYTNMSEGEGLSPLSLYVGTDDEPAAREAIALPAGTLILSVD
jgi:hypothetical protein